MYTKGQSKVFLVISKVIHKICLFCLVLHSLVACGSFTDWQFEVLPL